MRRAVTVLGVPTSAGAHHAGQERAPGAVREAGLLDRLRLGGIDVEDAGDVPGSIFRTDRRGLGVRNEESVVEVAASVADAVEDLASPDRLLLILGGDCTIELGVVAGLQRVHGDVGIAYLDGDADLVPPERGSGILDATGVAHLLGIAAGPLGRLGPRVPALTPDRIVLLGFDPSDPDSADPAALAQRPELLAIDGPSLRHDPDAAVARADSRLAGCDAVAIHVDVDAVDSGDLPLADYPHYGLGAPLEVIGRVTTGLLRMPRAAALTLTEVNPTHDPEGHDVLRYVSTIADALLDSRSG